MAIQGTKIKLWRASWLVGGGLLMFLWGNVTPVLAQHVICCMRLVDVKGSWFGALRTCDLSNMPPEQRAKICQEHAGCADVAPYCGVGRPCTETGSLIDIQNQALGERIAVSGTPFSLYYRSDRMRAGRAGDSFPYSLAGWSVGVHHAYKTDRSILYAGDGKRRIAKRPAAPTGNEIRIPSEDGALVYVFDAKGRHLRTLYALTGAVQYRFTYDKSGDLSAIADGSGNVSRIERDARAPAAIVAPNGQRTILRTTPEGDLISITNPAGETTRLSYSNNTRLASLTDAKGQVHRFTYSGQGSLLKDENPAGGHWALARAQAASGLKIALSSALGRTSTYEVERLSTGEERRVNTGPGGAAIRVETDKDGNDRVIYPDGTVSVSEFQPDPRWGTLVPVLKSFSLSTPGGRRLTVSAEKKINLAQAANPLSLQSLAESLTINGREYASSFSAGTKELMKKSPAGRRAITASDDYGRIVRQEVVGLLPVVFDYDDKGRLTSVAQGTGDEVRRATFSYDGEGRIASATDTLKRTTRFEYDPVGRVKRQIFADDREILYAYDANGNLMAVTPPGRPVHNFDYTALDQPQSYLPPSLGPGRNQTGYVYNRDKQLTRVTRPDGKNVDIEYDKAGRVSSLTTSQGKTRYLFDAKTEQLKTVTVADGGLSYEYDGFLLSRANWSGTIQGSVSRAYDDNFRISSVVINGKQTIDYGYDPDGLVARAGALALERHPMSGLVTGTKVGNVTTTHEHNRFGEVKRFSTAFKDKEIFAVEYERDHAGRIVKKAETVEGQTRTFGYTYDLAGRLTKLASDEGQESVYEYDSNGNRLAYKGPLGHSKGTYDAQDRLVAYSGEPYRYTANGELASKGAGGKTTSYDYDALGNLRRVNLTGGPRLDYVIDGANRRIGKKVNGKLVQGLLYGDQLKPVAELDGRNEVVSVFVYGTKVNMPEYVQKQDGIYRIVTDHLGSPRLVINVETGTIAQKMDYDEFGNVVQDTNPGFQPFGFAGGLYDPHTKLTRFGSRDYDAAVGRWTAKDPVRFAGAETNLYAYAYNDPNNFVDFNGLNGETTSFKVWSQGGNVEGTTRGFTYTGSGYAQSPSPGGGVSFGGEASFEGPVGPGTVNIDFTGSGTFGPEGTQGTFTGRADYTVPVGYGLDFRGDVSVSGDFSGEGSWGGEGSFGFGRGNTACRIGGRVGGDFHGNTTVQTTIQLPF
jgi:RHS repeat-associated protein